MAISIISIFVILMELLFITLVVIKAKKERIIISKSTAIWFIPVYLFIFMLYLTAYFYNNSSYSVTGIIKILSNALKSFAFEINEGILTGLLNVNVCYTIAFLLAYTLAIFTVVGTVLGVAKNMIINNWKVRKSIKNADDIVIGLNDSSLEYIKKNKKSMLWINKPLDSGDRDFLYENKIPFVKGDISVEQLFKKNFKGNVRYNFIAFEQEEENYQSLIEEFVKIKKTDIIAFLYLEVKYDESEVVRNEYLEIKHGKKEKEKNEDLEDENNESEEVKDECLDKKEKCNRNFFIRTFSRYELIARKLVEELTIPSLLPNDFYNENRTIKNDRQINVIFAGFGKVNSSLFTLFCQNNQLVALENNRLKAKLVNYYVIDKDLDATNTKRIEYTIKNIYQQEDLLPLPESIGNFDKINADINSEKVLNKLERVIKDEKAYNIIIVSYGSDYVNAELAMWLTNRFGNKNVKVACRVKETRLKSEEIIYFGNESDILTRQLIVEEELQKLAKNIHYQYSKLANVSDLEKENILDHLPHIELYSNYYSAMNIRFKLNLLGLDLVKDPNIKGLTKEEFLKIYNGGNKKSIEKNYMGTTAKHVLAYGEKLRWNAYYIFNGYRQMPKEKIKVKFNNKLAEYQINRKDHKLKTHACLTSHAGLEKLSQYILADSSNKKDKTDELIFNNIDFYQYDYMIFDNPDNDLVDLLFSLGYKIIKLKTQV